MLAKCQNSFGLPSHKKDLSFSPDMHSLYDVLLAQHARQLTPVRCAYATVLQLHRYFEDVVLENNLSALVIESLPLSPKRSGREKARVRDLARAGRRTFFFAHQA